MYYSPLLPGSFLLHFLIADTFVSHSPDCGPFRTLCLLSPLHSSQKTAVRAQKSFPLGYRPILCQWITKGKAAPFLEHLRPNILLRSLYQFGISEKPFLMNQLSWCKVAHMVSLWVFVLANSPRCLSFSPSSKRQSSYPTNFVFVCHGLLFRERRVTQRF